MLSVEQCDITKLEVDAIVNAANSGLKGGGGVDGAIHRAAGPELMNECREIIYKIGRLPAGEAVLTKGYNLPAKYIIQTVGPVWAGGHRGEPEKLANAYKNCLTIAKDLGLNSIAFPNISTGIYGFPKKQACDIAVESVSNFLRDNMFSIRVVFCCFDKENYILYSDKLKDIEN